MRLLDLFCGAGGCSVGYARAGFEVVGVDIHPQPNYPFEFIQMDALKMLRELNDYPALREHIDYPDGWQRHGFDAIHASPPCQAYSKAQKLQGTEHPDLIRPTRELLQATGLPYVIENVKGAPLIDPIMLEGQMFGLNTHRPRLFESNVSLHDGGMRPPPPRQAKMGRRPKQGEAIQVVGHFTDMGAAQEAMGIDWMSRKEMAEAIPPAYTELIGHQLMRQLTARKAA